MRLFLIWLFIFMSHLVTANEYDADNGEEINEICAGCHGEFGQGSDDSEYPRLAGLPAAFIAEQLHLFRDRKRPNMAMIEYIDERQMPDADILDVSTYLSAIKLATKLPPANPQDPDFDAYARLLASKKLMQIPRYAGDVVAGKKTYNRECRSCHGKQGGGKADMPMLAGQYTPYLKRQLKKYEQGLRQHDDDDALFFSQFTVEELDNIFAYLSIVDD